MAKKDTFLLVSLQEDKAKEVAQIITNRTCRKILDFLAENEDSTESKIAKELKLAISTVHYNLEALRKAKLVESDEFHYSIKGKEVNHYRLASKYIIIAPKSTWGIKEKLRSILPIGLMTAGAAFVINWLSRGMYKVSSATKSFGFAGQLSETMSVAPQVAESVATVTKTTVDSGALEVLPNAADLMYENITQIPENITKIVQTITVEPSAWQNPALWFVLGAIFVAVIYTLFYLIKRRK
ncbi:helix-turn-helix domain-containing protein [Candidatus Woesearchaeota archaeon]|nr:helix-turn-helix domain-containing protein [Candidatus Woesearchaeota archaeon]